MILSPSQVKKLEEVSGLKINANSNLELIASLYLDLCDPEVIATIEASNIVAQQQSRLNKAKLVSNVRILNPYELDELDSDSILEKN